MRGESFRTAGVVILIDIKNGLAKELPDLEKLLVLTRLAARIGIKPDIAVHLRPITTHAFKQFVATT